MGPRRRSTAGRQVTPAERDEVRAFAQLVINAPESSTLERMQAAANLRYVPAGHVTGMDALVTARVVETVGDLPVIELGPKIGFVAPDSARRIAHALHAAADAAEET